MSLFLAYYIFHVFMYLNASCHQNTELCTFFTNVVMIHTLCLLYKKTSGTGKNDFNLSIINI